MREREYYTFPATHAGAARTGPWQTPIEHFKQKEERGIHTYPALRLIQVLPGHPLADPKR